ncbi:MAG: hypothetical protein DIU74_001020 [Pseudomonadota bacterium]|nr:MAG: hypothetical protein DIU74_01455 [Pseudomonadota bacterium]
MKVFDPKKHDFRPEDKEKRSREAEREAQQEGANLDEALKESFPASDPPAIASPGGNEPVEPQPPLPKKPGPGK